MPPPAPYTTDTQPEAHELQLALIRRMPPVRHVQRAVELSRQLKCMTLSALERMHPDFGEDEIRLLFIEHVYGKELAVGVRIALAKRRACEHR